jgi:uncharacterized protein
LNYNFEWDSGKAKGNLRKHKVSFQRAATVFLDPFAISLFDEEHSRDEERWITMGKDNNEVILVVAHTFEKVESKACTIRIISARKATKRERHQYE